MPDVSDAGQLRANGVPSHGFLFTPTDVGNIVDPNTTKEPVVRSITATLAGVIVVKYKDSAATVAVPVAAGIPHRGLFTRILSTGTTAGITAAGVLCEY
jgi:hypothetical protein